MKLKNIIMILVFACSMTLHAQAQELKVGYTNVEMILAYMPESESVEKKLETKGKELEGRIETKKSYIEVLYDQWVEKEQSQTWPSDEEKMSKQKEIMDLEDEINRDSREAEETLLLYQQQLMEPVILKLQKAIDEVATEQSFTYILNQTSGMNILFGMKTLDCTDLIAGKLKITFPEN